MDLPGIEVRTIVDMVGKDHFCEVFFTDVRVPAENLVGVEGEAFAQTMTQLENERGGIDRLVSNRPLYDAALERADTSDPLVRQEIAAIETGYRLGRLLVLPRSAWSVPQRIQRGNEVLLHRSRATRRSIRGPGPRRGGNR